MGTLARSVLSICAAAILLGGCGGLNHSTGDLGALPARTARQPLFGNIYKSLYSFNGVADGEYPSAGLIPLNGALYGTATNGGKGYNFGYGIVFRLTTSGKETILHRFHGGGDGRFPAGALISYNGKLYGTTQKGTGSARHGTVFEISPSGAERVLYRFKGAPDGEHPVGRLLAFQGLLYGATAQGGTSTKCFGGCGTAFSITPSGTENVVYSFKFGASDGASPVGGLTSVGDTLYGLTAAGGSSNEGTLFAVTPGGHERLVYAFGTSVGFFPVGDLVDVGGVLYGTTSEGGTSGVGTIFSVTLSGTARTLYSFGSSALDGWFSNAGLFYSKGWLYGTTPEGGYGNNGTVYRVTPSGNKAEVLYRFGSSPDGSYPACDLMMLNGALYGTTEHGGKDARGTVFQISSH